MALNSKMTAEVSGLQTYGTYTGVNKDMVQSLIDLVGPEYTQAQRGHLDQISPAAHRQLYAELIALKAGIVNTP